MRLSFWLEKTGREVEHGATRAGVGEATLEGSSCDDREERWPGREELWPRRPLCLTLAVEPRQLHICLVRQSCHPEAKSNTQIGFCLIAV